MTIAVVVILAIMILTIVAAYNYLVKLKNRVDNIFSSVEVLLEKRYDLLPSLFDVVQGFMAHERALFKEVSSLRTLAIKTHEADTKLHLDAKLVSPLNGILIAVENYPQLKSSENVLKLQAALSEIEEQISAARRAYNQSVTDHNNALEMIPTNILAALMKYKKRALYEASELSGKTEAAELIG
ncbi:MAG: LemA family protein [Campylobacteraceae bacterium]|jgi:LemA protein|nr:LemA family protein [Campylobacteraceae bacterium]